MVAQATSTARDNAAMAEGFMQAGLHKLRLFKDRDSQKRKREGSPQPCHARSHQSTNLGWHNRSSSNRAPRTVSKSYKGSKPSAGQKSQPKGKQKVGEVEVERTPRPDLVSQARGGSQGS